MLIYCIREIRKLWVLVHMKVSREKVPLVIAAPRFVVSWLLLVVRPLPVIVSTTLWFVVEFLKCSISSFRRFVPSFRLCV